MWQYNYFLKHIMIVNTDTDSRLFNVHLYVQEMQLQTALCGQKYVDALSSCCRLLDFIYIWSCNTRRSKKWQVFGFYFWSWSVFTGLMKRNLNAPTYSVTLCVCPFLMFHFIKWFPSSLTKSTRYINKKRIFMCKKWQKWGSSGKLTDHMTSE